MMKAFLKFFARWEPLILAALTALWVLDRPGLFPFLLILPFLWWGGYLRSGRFLPRTPLDLPLTLLVVWTLFSLWVTPDLSASAGKVLGVVLGISVYYAVIRFARTGRFSPQDSSPSGGRLQWILLGAASAGTGVAGLGLLGADWFTKYPILTRLAKQIPDLIPALPGAPSGFQPNAISGTLTLFTPLTIWLGYRIILQKDAGFRSPAGIIPPWMMKTGLLLMLAVQGVWWLLSQTRGALLGLAAGLLFLSVLEFKPSWKIPAISLPLLPVAAAYTYWFLAEDLSVLESVAGTNLSGTLAFRFQVWEWASLTLQDFPFTGVGYNMFREVAPLLYFGPNLGDVAHAHNLFLDVGVSLGFGGMIIYLALWLVNLWTLWKSYLQNPQTWVGGGALALLAGWYAFLIFGLADTIPLGSKLGMGIFLALGVGQGIVVEDSKLEIEDGERFNG